MNSIPIIFEVDEIQSAQDSCIQVSGRLIEGRLDVGQTVKNEHGDAWSIEKIIFWRAEVEFLGSGHSGSLVLRQEEAGAVDVEFKSLFAGEDETGQV